MYKAITAPEPRVSQNRMKDQSTKKTSPGAAGGRRNDGGHCSLLVVRREAISSAHGFPGQPRVQIRPGSGWRNTLGNSSSVRAYQQY
eukprot:scaffold28704_cov69-Phaeocystis_antarctica.AAC.1